MEKISQFFTNDITQAELISYFSTEIICLIGILINLVMFLFFSRKCNIKRLSDLTTFIVFCVNSLISFAIFLKNKLIFGEFSFTLFEENIVIDNQSLLYKFLIYLFFVLFVLCTYRLTRKARFKTTLINPCLLFLSIASVFLMQVQNGIVAFILLDLCALFIYKFASNMRIRKTNQYSIDFILMSVASTILFFSFYAFSFVVKEELQKVVIQVCMTCALLLKAGLFPVFNYTINRHIKNNLPYCALLFGFLPILGVVTFVKFLQNINLSNEIYCVVISTFLAILVLTSAINVFKVKNLSRFLANYNYIISSLYLFAILFMQDKIFCLNSLFAQMFLIFACFSVISILKINLKATKININILKGLFVKNRYFATLFSVVLLTAINIIPSICLLNNVQVLKGIYLFDKIGSSALLLFIVANLLAMFNCFKMIQILYTKNNLSIELTKRTTLNYVVPVVIIFVLIVMMFL